jgi:hypothetical protein
VQLKVAEKAVDAYGQLAQKNNTMIVPGHMGEVVGTDRHRHDAAEGQQELMPAPALNVLGTPLVPCSYDPLTGWYRDGCCHTDARMPGQPRGLRAGDGRPSSTSRWSAATT